MNLTTCVIQLVFLEQSWGEKEIIKYKNVLFFDFQTLFLKMYIFEDAAFFCLVFIQSTQVF